MSTVNRVVWVIVGVLLTAAGAAGVLANLGALPGVDRDRAVVTPGMDERWRSWHGGATAAVIVVGLVIALAGLMLLRAQFRRRGGAAMPDLSRSVPATSPAPTTAPAAHISTSDNGAHVAGRTRVATSTLNHALTRDLLANTSIRRAGVRLTGERNAPDLRMRLAVTPDADIGELHRQIDAAVSRFRTTSGLRPHVAEVLIRMSSAQRERVH